MIVTFSNTQRVSNNNFFVTSSFSCDLVYCPPTSCSPVVHCFNSECHWSSHHCAFPISPALQVNWISFTSHTICSWIVGTMKNLHMAFLILTPLWNSQTDDCLSELMMLHVHMDVKGLEWFYHLLAHRLWQRGWIGGMRRMCVSGLHSPGLLPRTNKTLLGFCS